MGYVDNSVFVLFVLPLGGGMEVEMQYIVMDLEWNQCPSGKDDEVEAIPFEIFEIGAVKLDDNMECVDSFSCYIKPQVYKELHYIAKGLTHVSQESLDAGVSFTDAVTDFLDWCEAGGEYRICTWGTSDLVELQRNMKYYNVTRTLGYPLFYYDVQKLFSIDREDGKARRALETAVDMLGIEKDIDFHSAISDAQYTAKVLARLDFAKVGGFFSIDTYRIPQSVKEEIRVNYGTYEKFITKGYNTKEELVNCVRLLSTRCYLCGQTARKKIRWFTMNSKMHYCLAECREHGFIKGRFKIREDDNGKFYASRVLKLTNESGAEEVRQRQLEVRKRRREKRQKKKS